MNNLNVSVHVCIMYVDVCVCIIIFDYEYYMDMFVHLSGDRNCLVHSLPTLEIHSFPFDICLGFFSSFLKK